MDSRPSQPHVLAGQTAELARKQRRTTIAPGAITALDVQQQRHHFMMASRGRGRGSRGGRGQAGSPRMTQHNQRVRAGSGAAGTRARAVTGQFATQQRQPYRRVAPNNAGRPQGQQQAQPVRPVRPARPPAVPHDRDGRLSPPPVMAQARNRNGVIASGIPTLPRQPRRTQDSVNGAFAPQANQQYQRQQQPQNHPQAQNRQGQRRQPPPSAARQLLSPRHINDPSRDLQRTQSSVVGALISPRQEARVGPGAHQGYTRAQHRPDFRRQPTAAPAASSGFAQSEVFATPYVEPPSAQGGMQYGHSDVHVVHGAGYGQSEVFDDPAQLILTENLIVPLHFALLTSRSGAGGTADVTTSSSSSSRTTLEELILPVAISAHTTARDVCLHVARSLKLTSFVGMFAIQSVQPNDGADTCRSHSGPILGKALERMRSKQMAQTQIHGPSGVKGSAVRDRLDLGRALKAGIGVIGGQGAETVVQLQLFDCANCKLQDVCRLCSRHCHRGHTLVYGRRNAPVSMCQCGSLSAFREAAGGDAVTKCLVLKAPETKRYLRYGDTLWAVARQWIADTSPSTPMSKRESNSGAAAVLGPAADEAGEHDSVWQPSDTSRRFVFTFAPGVEDQAAKLMSERLRERMTDSPKTADVVVSQGSHQTRQHPQQPHPSSHQRALSPRAAALSSSQPTTSAAPRSGPLIVRQPPLTAISGPAPAPLVKSRSVTTPAPPMAHVAISPRGTAHPPSTHHHGAQATRANNNMASTAAAARPHITKARSATVAVGGQGQGPPPTPPRRALIERTLAAARKKHLREPLPTLPSDIARTPDIGGFVDYMSQIADPTDDNDDAAVARWGMDHDDDDDDDDDDNDLLVAANSYRQRHGGGAPVVRRHARDSAASRFSDAFSALAKSLRDSESVLDLRSEGDEEEDAATVYQPVAVAPDNHVAAAMPSPSSSVTPFRHAALPATLQKAVTTGSSPFRRRAGHPRATVHGIAPLVPPQPMISWDDDPRQKNTSTAAVPLPAPPPPEDEDEEPPPPPPQHDDDNDAKKKEAEARHMPSHDDQPDPPPPPPEEEDDDDDDDDDGKREDVIPLAPELPADEVLPVLPKTFTTKDEMFLTSLLPAQQTTSSAEAVLTTSTTTTRKVGTSKSTAASAMPLPAIPAAASARPQAKKQRPALMGVYAGLPRFDTSTIGSTASSTYNKRHTTAMTRGDTKTNAKYTGVYAGLPPLDPTDPTRCLLCANMFGWEKTDDGKSRAGSDDAAEPIGPAYRPDVCDHRFCRQCLEDWFEHTESCPFCEETFVEARLCTEETGVATTDRHGQDHHQQQQDASSKPGPRRVPQRQSQAVIRLMGRTSSAMSLVSENNFTPSHYVLGDVRQAQQMGSTAKDGEVTCPVCAFKFGHRRLMTQHMEDWHHCQECRVTGVKTAAVLVAGAGVLLCQKCIFAERQRQSLLEKGLQRRAGGSGQNQQAPPPVVMNRRGAGTSAVGRRSDARMTMPPLKDGASLMQAATSAAAAASRTNTNATTNGNEPTMASMPSSGQVSVGELLARKHPDGSPQYAVAKIILDKKQGYYWARVDAKDGAGNPLPYIFVATKDLGGATHGVECLLKIRKPRLDGKRSGRVIQTK